VLRYIVAGKVLYHEIGHHIHAVHRPVHEQRENVADDWSGKSTKLFYRRHYWYLFPFLYVLARQDSRVLTTAVRLHRILTNA
jgi:hypothetical protein